MRGLVVSRRADGGSVARDTHSRERARGQAFHSPTIHESSLISLPRVSQPPLIATLAPAAQLYNNLQ